MKPDPTPHDDLHAELKASVEAGDVARAAKCVDLLSMIGTAMREGPPTVRFSCPWCDVVHETLVGATDIPSATCAAGHRCVAGDRATWSPRARESYNAIDAALPSNLMRSATRLEQVSLTPTFSMPSSWWQHLKYALRMRWPRAFGWLEPRWTQVWRKP